MARWLMIAVSALYLGTLFAVAYWGDRRADRGRSVISSGGIYALSLAVYATSWTFYGSVGRAAGTGVGFLPIYLGPTIMAAFWWFVLRAMIRTSKRHRITSLADLVAHRYGNSAVLGALVAVIAMVGIIPYIALQLKAVSDTFTVLHTGNLSRSVGEATPVLQDTALYVALFLAAFTILFGTRHLDASERHEGMVAAIALESIVKLVAFLGIGLFVTFSLFDGPGDLFARAAANPDTAKLFTLDQVGYGSWFWLTVLSMFAIIFLPRQFQVAVVENVNEKHLDTAVWLFPLYLLAINLFVLPIAIAGMLTFDGSGAGGANSVNPDTFVLALPLNADHPGVALMVFVGGLSAATGMVIVETIALATMVSNSIVVPALLWFERHRPHPRGLQLPTAGLPLASFGYSGDLGRLVLWIRRSTIVGLLLLGYAYFRIAGEGPALVSIGLVSFAAVAQFAPAVLGGLMWRGGTRNGALAGLLAGFGIWIYSLLLPTFARSGWLPTSLLDDGPWGIAALRPGHLLGLEGMDELSHGMFWSMLLNIGLYVAVSLAHRPTDRKSKAATTTVTVAAVDDGRESITTLSDLNDADEARVSVVELQALLQRFLGTDAAKEVLEDYLAAREAGSPLAGSRVADGELVRHVEILLSGAVGTTSARVMVASVVNNDSPLWVDDVMDILDEASQVLAYSRELEKKSQELQRATEDLREANERLRELDVLKDEFVSSVSHELRTPLTSIRALSEILLDNLDLPSEERGKYLRIVVDETERLTRLINQILDISKLASGAVDWQISDVDLIGVVQDAAMSCEQLFTKRGSRLAVSVPPYVPCVPVDRDRIMQVVINLLSNASKFCATDGEVSMRLSVEHETLRVDVTDDGEGIPAADQERIFERFQQVKGSGSAPQGTGLGLPISREIVHHFGGQLWVRSSPRHGATFSFTVPMKPAHAGRAVEAR
ncbi:MAG: sensor histidine kinase [Kineosporiaceae bacterium]